MATKKQRRRREKLQRHEYEYVVETEEGEEVVDSPRQTAQGAKAKAGGAPKVVDRRGRVIPPPTWARVFKRGLIFGPILLLLMFVTGGDLALGAKILNAAILLAIFIPFSYLVDTMIYRSVQRRQRRDSGR
ncbi:MAG: hypothetical protein IT201_04765 [Thermoleophilia bacterium]|nr:hypothetical protein [Thermoleophilia bacterium]